MVLSHAHIRVPVCVLPLCILTDYPPSSSNRQHRRDKSFQTPLKQLIRNPNPTRMLHRRQRILHHILDVQIGPNLMQVLAQVNHLCIGEHDKLHARGRLVVVQLVLAGAVAEEGVVGAAQLGNEVAQRKDEAKDELLIVRVRHAFAHGGHDIPVGRNRGAGLRARRGFGRRRRGARGRPAPRVDALSWRDAVSACTA